jgi:hypothetical protein
MRIDQHRPLEPGSIVPVAVMDDGCGLCECCGDRLERGDLVVHCGQGLLHADCAEGELHQPGLPLAAESHQ